MLLDLSHPFTKNMPVYPGDPCANLRQIATIQKDGFCDHQLTSGMHVGTHVDAPAHTIEEGSCINDLSLSAFEGTAILIDVRGIQTIEAHHIPDIEHPDTIVLFLTGWSQYYNTPQYYKNWPILSILAAQRLRTLGTKAIGMDTPGPDGDSHLRTHKILLGANILIIENLTNLEPLINLPPFFLTFYPVAYQADGAHTRVIAHLNTSLTSSTPKGHS